MHKRVLSSSYRVFKAYAVTLRLILSYLGLYFLRRFISQVRFEVLSERTHQRTSRRIVVTLLELKGLYIKIGQTLSVMGNFLPRTFAEGFESLQDAVPPHPFDEVRKRFLKDFGKAPEAMFAQFDPVPLASASLGQVHVATSHSGVKLAVKVQYPDVEDIARSDLKTIRNIFCLVNIFVPQYKLKTIHEEFAKIIRAELDYRIEADNIERIRKNFENDAHFGFPVVWPELSSEKVLTLTFIEGAKVTNLPLLAQYGIDRTHLATDLIHFYCKQIFIDGIYHADPHPGNILITPAGQIAMIDFGAVATVSEPMKKGLTLFVEGLIRRDTRALTEAIKMMGFVSKGSTDETLDKVVEYFYSKISGIRIENFRNLDVTQFQNLQDFVELKRMNISFSELATLFVIPREWVMLERAMLLLSGLTAQLDEHLNPVEIVIPYAEKYLLGGEKRIAEIVVTAAKELLTAYLCLPDAMNRTLKKINAGEIKITVKGLETELRGLRSGLMIVAGVLLACTSGVLSYFMTLNGQVESAARFEIVFYASALLTLLSFFRK